LGGKVTKFYFGAKHAAELWVLQLASHQSDYCVIVSADIRHEVAVHVIVMPAADWANSATVNRY